MFVPIRVCKLSESLWFIRATYLYFKQVFIVNKLIEILLRHWLFYHNMPTHLVSHQECQRGSFGVSADPTFVPQINQHLYQTTYSLRFIK